ncbi:hypothetical protein [Halorhabdus rudnickae]|uniref:hypothetical protein n=1 Tax=Halorhabdus rudnickae TaxID=1775544 RepID=UPI001083A7A8|nr:hypothetical protein [Halorhabdus rudnickae]
MYELLVGRTLSRGTAKDVMDRYLFDAPEPPTEVESNLPTAIDDTELAVDRIERIIHIASRVQRPYV